MSYLEERIYNQMGLTREQCQTELWYTVGDQQKQKTVCDIFQSDEKDNIDILVYDLQRNIIEYEKEQTTNKERFSDNSCREVQYKVKRMNPEWCKQHPKEGKYRFPAGKVGTYPFFPPLLLEQYEAASRNNDISNCRTLVLTEGYFKSMKACICGIPTIGLGSVTLFSDQKRMLYSDITRFINTVRPQNIVILYDGDCTDLSKDCLKDLEADRRPDIGKRPQMFLTSLTRLRELLLEFTTADGKPVEVYFAYVRKMREDNPPKGLDDLLCDKDFQDKTAEIAEDLLTPSRPGIYFEKLNLRTQHNKMRRLFGLQSPKQFYEMHADEIGTHAFRFGGGIYKYNAKDKNLDTEISAELKDYLHVGNTFYLRYRVQGINGELGSYKLLRRDPSTINQLHGENSSKKVLQNAHYELFGNYPSHNNYQAVIGGEYNLYSELTYEPAVGEWVHIDRLLQHIFGAPDTTYYKIAIDYLTLLWNKPTQILPIICLVSKERGTGKTTFLNLLKYMFESNVVIGGNDMITSRFNTSLAGKLVIGIDETNLADNQMITERIKMLATAETIQVEGKGRDAEEVRNFCKFVLCSNEVRKFIYTDPNEIRFWVVKLRPLSDELKEDDFTMKMKEEVPAFAHFLQNRKMTFESTHPRQYFSPLMLDNEDLRALKEASRPQAERTLRDYLHDMFLDTGTSTLYFDIRYFQQNIPDFQRKDTGYIRSLLEQNLGVEKKKEAERYAMPFRSIELESQGEVRWPSAKVMCRPYVFEAKDYCNAAELEYIAQCSRKQPADNKTQSTQSSTQSTLSLPFDNNSVNSEQNSVSSVLNKSIVQPNPEDELTKELLG